MEVNVLGKRKLLRRQDNINMAESNLKNKQKNKYIFPAKLAEKMQKYCTGMSNLLIVDDVYTTGGSIRKFAGDRSVIGAVVFARTKPPDWITPLFLMKGWLNE